SLAAWLARPPSAAHAPVVIVLHGWGANASTLWPVVEPLTAAGLAVLLLDAANHGDSSTEDFSSLPRFAEDLATARQALAGLEGVDATRVALLGHSVGAAAVLLHAASDPQVRAVVSLSAFAHPAEVMARWLREHRLPLRWPGRAILDEVQQTIGARFDDIAPLRSITRIAAPVLLVHGEHDEVVPLTDMLRLRARARHAEALVVGGGHDLRETLPPHAPRLVAFLQVALR
ncbi:MAG: alpha/beta fold hydrolase, partial [Burkholderiales bacterium]|nr:alpha/beta fold hydrolase [Burkholderiales bacterium]